MTAAQAQASRPVLTAIVVEPLRSGGVCVTIESEPAAKWRPDAVVYWARSPKAASKALSEVFNKSVRS
jgi:hypothetical protein